MIGCILAAVCMGFCMTSCSEDGDDGDGGGAGSGIGTNSAKLDNATFKTPYGFWHRGDQDTEEMEDNLVLMEFYSFDPTAGKFPSKMSFVGIEYEMPKGQKEITSTVLRGNEYNLYLAKDVTMTSEGIQCGSKYNDTDAPDLKIVRNGNKYTITVEGVTLEDENNREYTFSFNYSGKLTNKQIAL